MTLTPGPSMPDPQLRPFAAEPGRWQQEVHRIRGRAKATGLYEARELAAAGGFWTDFARVDELTDWGWLRWLTPLLEDDPDVTQIAVLSPTHARTARWAGRWLTRRPPLRIYFDERRRFWVTGTTVLAAVLSLIGVSAAMANGLHADIGLPLMLLIPALADHLPGRLDVRARAHVRIVQDEPALQQMQRCVALQQSIQAADDHEGPELAQAVRLGHHLLWDIAGLLTQRGRGNSLERALESEHLLAGLAGQAAETRAAKEERDDLVCRIPGPGGGGAAFDEQSAETEPALDLLPGALVEDVKEALCQAETAYRAATHRVRHIDRTTTCGRNGA
ncbi:hypothetical protein ACIBCO_36855 [Streptomyces violascens]|uniref:hypothetical protein n=1 Tax=Streptomyces violascens TaxID=67381 RepID=UPI0037A29B69